MAPNSTLAAADRVRLSSQTGRMLPDLHAGSLTGLPGWDVMAAQQQQIDVPELRWPRSVKTYEAMRRDSQVQGLLTSVFLPIRHMDWYVDPTGTTGTAAQEIAEDLGLPLLGQPPVEDGAGVDFDDHLRLALLAIALGHQYFEEFGEIDGTGPTLKYRLRGLMQYPPTTIARINITPTGDLRSVQQNTVADFPEVMADVLLPYVWDREGANWAGRPLLLGIYKNWLAKDELVRSDVVAKRRFAGLPVVESTDANVGKAAHAEAAKMAALVQSGDGAGVSMPYGTRLQLLGIQGTLPDAIASIRYHDEQMARAFMQMFAELGKTASGSRALGTTLLDHYALGVLAVAKWTRKSLMVLVRRIVERNYGPGTVLPRIAFRQDDHEDITIQDLTRAIETGLIVVDDDLEALVRERANLSPRNPDEPGRTPPGKVQPPAAVAAARARHRHVRATAATTSPADTAHTDFAALQARYRQAIAALAAAWTDVTATQIADLVDQVKRASTPGQLAQIMTPAIGTELLTPLLADVVNHGAQTVADEATAQGASLPAPDLGGAHARIVTAAGATAALLARSLSESAASKAVAVSSGSLSPDEIATVVGDYLGGLSGASRDYEFAGLVTKAQNTGRLAAMAQAPDATRFYASALNDANECDACAEEDETEFATLDEAEQDFPGGGYVGCEGGLRCRCTVVAVFAEAAPSGG